MNDIYGIDPCAPGNLRDLVDLIRLFGPSEGRFIANFPMTWASDLHHHMKQVSDVNRYAMVEAWVQLGRHAVIPVNTRFKANQTWQENALSLREEVVKIIGPAGRPKNIAHPIDEILIDTNGFPDSRGGHIPRTPESYVKAILPLLSVSPKIAIIDPYFALRYKDKYTNKWRAHRRGKFLELLFKRAISLRRVECIEIFTDPTKISESSICIDDLKKIANTSGAGNIDLQIHHLNKSNPLDRHGRYILGMSSGLQFDHGFDTSDDGSTNHVEWISKSALNPLLDRFTSRQ